MLTLCEWITNNLLVTTGWSPPAAQSIFRLQNLNLIGFISMVFLFLSTKTQEGEEYSDPHRWWLGIDNCSRGCVKLQGAGKFFFHLIALQCLLLKCTRKHTMALVGLLFENLNIAYLTLAVKEQACCPEGCFLLPSYQTARVQQVRSRCRCWNTNPELNPNPPQPCQKKDHPCQPVLSPATAGPPTTQVFFKCA